MDQTNMESPTKRRKLKTVEPCEAPWHSDVQLRNELIKLDTFMEYYGRSLNATLDVLQYSKKYQRDYRNCYREDAALTLLDENYNYKSDGLRSPLSSTDYLENDELRRSGHRNRITDSAAWSVVTIWRLLVTVQRYTTIAKALMVVSLSNTNSHDFYPSRLDQIDAQHISNERELIRYLFLRCHPFRLILAVTEWCEWASRMESCGSTNDLILVNKTAGVGHLRYPETLSNLVSSSRKECRLTVASKFYHLDLPTTLLVTNSQQPQLRRNRLLPSASLPVVSLHDLDEASQFYRVVWSLLMAGRHEMLNEYVETIAGEPWIRTLIEGLEPVCDSESLATLLYDSALSSLPTALLDLLEEEMDTDSDTVGMIHGKFKRITRKSKSEGSYDGQNNAGGQETSSNKHNGSSSWDQLSWITKVLFQSAGVVVRSGSSQNARVEEAIEGNRWRNLMIDTALSVVNSEGLSLNTCEKALYGYLSNSASSMLPACSTWENVIWANCIELVGSFIRQLSERSYDEWESLLSDWNSNVIKVFVGIFHSADLRFNRTATPDELVSRFIIANLILGHLDPSFFLTMTSFLIRQSSLTLGRKLQKPNDAVTSQTDEAANMTQQHLEAPHVPHVSVHVYGLGHGVGTILREAFAPYFTTETERERWVDDCDQLLWLWISTRPPHETRDSVLESILLLSHLSSHRRVEASIVWLLSLHRVLISSGAVEDPLDVLQFAVHQLIDVSHEMFLLVIFRMVRRVWSITSSGHSSPTPIITSLSTYHRALLQISLFILVCAPAFSECAYETKGNVTSSLLAGAKFISTCDSSHNKISSDVTSSFVKPVLKLIHQSSYTPDRLTDEVPKPHHQNFDRTECLSNINFLTLLIALASPLMELLARDAIASVFTVGCQQTGFPQHQKNRRNQQHQSERLGHQSSIKPDGASVKIREAEVASDRDGNPDQISKRSVAVPPASSYMNTEDEMLQDEHTAFYVGLLDRRLIDPCIQLIDNLLVGKVSYENDVARRGLRHMDNGKESDFNSTLNNQNQRDCRASEATAATTTTSPMPHSSIRDTLKRFPKTVPSGLQPPDRPVSPCATGDAIGSSVWDAVSPMEDVTLCLTPIVHYYSIRQYLDSLLGMKDFRVLLIDSVYQMAGKQQVMVHELTSLASRLSQSFKSGFPWNPYMDGPITTPHSLTGHSVVFKNLISLMDQEYTNLLMSFVIDVFTSFIEAVAALPQENRSPLLWRKLKDAALSVVGSLCSAIQNHPNSFPIQIRVSMESVWADLTSLV